MIVMVQNSSKNAWCLEVQHYILLCGGESKKKNLHGAERVNLQIIIWLKGHYPPKFNVNLC